MCQSLARKSLNLLTFTSLFICHVLSTLTLNAHSNLTNANHLVFLSPVPATAKEQWDTAYTQAIGRARRFGQTKEVHVYHYLALNTIDVDLHEQWEDKKLHESSKTGGWLLSPLGDLNEEEKKQDWGSGFFKYQV